MPIEKTFPLFEAKPTVNNNGMFELNQYIWDPVENLTLTP